MNSWHRKFFCVRKTKFFSNNGVQWPSSVKCLQIKIWDKSSVVGYKLTTNLCLRHRDTQEPFGNNKKNVHNILNHASKRGSNIYDSLVVCRKRKSFYREKMNDVYWLSFHEGEN